MDLISIAFSYGYIISVIQFIGRSAFIPADDSDIECDFNGKIVVLGTASSNS